MRLKRYFKLSSNILVVVEILVKAALLAKVCELAAGYKLTELSSGSSNSSTVMSLTTSSSSSPPSSLYDPHCGILPPIVKHYIYGGKPSMIEQWPWQLHMKITANDVDDFNDNDHANCGGSLLGDNFIITAAHCFTDRHLPRIFLLIGQNYTKNDNYKQIAYERIFIHPKYEEFSGPHEFSTNDVALIKLKPNHKYPLSNVRPCLPKKFANIPPNSICYITGFGATNKNDNEQIKRIKEGKVAIKNDKICIRSLSLNFYDPETMMCAGRAKGLKANSCQGDSGGPLVCEGRFADSKRNQWYLFGITSFGALDCSSYTSSVYTKVSTYIDWINETMQK